MNNQIISAELKKLHLPSPSSHKGQNGRLLIIGGSHLFHAASLWALQVASRIVDLVHYSSVAQNNQIVQKLKEEFRNGIVVPRSEIESYIEEDDCVLIGPGMVRTTESGIKNYELVIKNIKDINKISNEGLQTYYLTKYLLQKYPHKKWVIDAGALQMLDPDDIPENAILTPHRGEFEGLESRIKDKTLEERAQLLAQKYNCTVLLKGETDIVASKDKIKEIKGGNAGMTKGGTGDVLAGLVAGLYCKNDAWISAVVASYINKKAGEELFETKGYWFNASDLADQIPQMMKSLFIK
jgi:NAD(P)H-hydrate epimerase